MENRLSSLAGSLVDEIVLYRYGINQTKADSTSSSQKGPDSTSSSSSSSLVSLEEKISNLARKVLFDLVGGNGK